MKAGRQATRPAARRIARARRRGGFTLVELVISAALMAVILSAAYLCLSAGSASQKLIESRADVYQSARVAMNLLAADLRAACPLSPDFDFLGMHRTQGGMPADNLDLATHNYTPRRPREADFCEVSYYADRDPKSGLLTLRRRRNPTLAPDPLAGGRREEIAGGLRGVQFEYYDGLEWYDTWGEIDGQRNQPRSARAQANLSGLPEAVRVTLWFDPSPPVSLREARVAEREKPPTEPPLKFQTVVRLNLAAIAGTAGAGGGATNTAPAAASGPAARPGPGGGPP